MPAERDLRRWIRHNRDLQGFSAIFPSGGQDPGSPRLIAPWLSDTIQLTTPVPPEIRTTVPATGAPGADFSARVPQGELWKLLAFFFTLTTDVNVANRDVHVDLTNPTGSRVWLGQSPTTQTASLTRDYSCSHIGNFGGSLGSQREILLPGVLWMPAGYRLRTIIANIQAGDQIFNVAYYYELWPG